MKTLVNKIKQIGKVLSLVLPLSLAGCNKYSTDKRVENFRGYELTTINNTYKGERLSRTICIEDTAKIFNKFSHPALIAVDKNMGDSLWDYNIKQYGAEFSKDLVKYANQDSLNSIWEAIQISPVSTGDYSFGEKITSKNFKDCSAVIIDYGDSCIFAHSVPGNSIDLPYFTVLGSYDVADNLIKKCKEKKIDLSKSFAVINAGSKQSLDSIFSNFAKYEIRIKKATYEKENEERLRKVSYDSKKNVLDINYYDN